MFWALTSWAEALRRAFHVSFATRSLAVSLGQLEDGRTITTGSEVHIVRRDEVRDGRFGTVRARVVMLLKDLANGGGGVEDDDSLVEDLEGEDVTKVLCWKRREQRGEEKRDDSPHSANWMWGRTRGKILAFPKISSRGGPGGRRG